MGPETKPEANPDITPEEEPETTPEQGSEEKPEVNGQPTGDSKQPTDANDVQKAVQSATLPKTDGANNAVIPAAIAAVGSAFLGLVATLRRRKEDF